jgi:hypothetical protein
MNSQFDDWRRERGFHPRDRAYLLGKVIMCSKDIGIKSVFEQSPNSFDI